MYNKLDFVLESDYIKIIQFHDRKRNTRTMRVKNIDLLIGITLDRFKGISPSELLLIIKKVDVEFVEITKSVFDDLPSFIKNLGNIRTGFHLPNRHDAGFDLSYHQQQREIDQLIQLINQYHRDLNIIYCLSHPPENRTSSLSEDEMISYLLENLKKLEPLIILENIQSWSLLKFEHFMNQAREALGEKLAGQCFDAPHYFLQGEDPVEYLHETDGKIQLIHLSDCKKNYDAHLPFGLSGILPIDDILATLKKQHYKGIINLELLPRNITDIKPLMDSYLKVVRTFDRMKYMKSKFKLLLYTPLLIQKMKHVF